MESNPRNQQYLWFLRPLEVAWCWKVYEYFKRKITSPKFYPNLRTFGEKWNQAQYAKPFEIERIESYKLELYFSPRNQSQRNSLSWLFIISDKITTWFYQLLTNRLNSPKLNTNLIILLIAFVPVLPIEILEKILSYIPQKKTLSLRLVCHQWKSEIDQRFKFQVDFGRNNINETNLQTILNYHVKKVIIGWHRQFLLKPLPLPVSFDPPRQSIFKHPKTLRNLHITDLHTISEQNYLRLLKECGNNLTNLVLTFNHRFWNEFHVENYWPLVPFPNLKSLEIQDTRVFTQMPIHINSTNDLFINILKNVALSSPLKTIQIKLFSEIRFKSDLKYSAAIFRLIAKQHKTLEIVKVRYDWDFYHDLDDRFLLDSKSFNFDPTELHRVRNLRIIHLYFDEDTKLAGASVISDAWKKLVMNQNQLEHLDLVHLPHLKCKFIQKIALKNWNTLSTLHLSFEKDTNPVEEDGILDMSGLEQCLNLTTLQLYLSLLTRRMNPQYVQNFKLPASIKRLDMRGFHILTCELETWLGHELDSLVYVNFCDCGGLEDGYGFDEGTLELLQEKKELLDIHVSQMVWNNTRHFGRFESMVAKRFGARNTTQYILIGLKRKSTRDKFVSTQWDEWGEIL